MSDNNSIIDGRLIHPFNCIISGPTGSGKTTFLLNLLLYTRNVISIEKFDYIIIFSGSELFSLAETKRKLTQIREIYPETLLKVINLDEEYQSKSELADNLSLEFLQQFMIPGKCGCIVFDDLMSELTDAGLLVPLFTKISSHNNISFVLITQNLFHRTSGKHASDHVTLYRNTHYLVLFQNPLDNSVFQNVARRLSSTSAKIKYLTDLLQFITNKYRYVLIDGKLQTPHEIRFRTDIFNRQPVAYQRVFTTTE